MDHTGHGWPKQRLRTSPEVDWTPQGTPHGAGRARVASMIVWLNGTHGVGKTTTSAFVQRLIPDSRVLDAEKVGAVLMDVTPSLPQTGNFQHWPPWRPLVVETARRLLEYTGDSRDADDGPG